MCNLFLCVYFFPEISGVFKHPKQPPSYGLGSVDAWEGVNGEQPKGRECRPPPPPPPLLLLLLPLLSLQRNAEMLSMTSYQHPIRINPYRSKKREIRSDLRQADGQTDRQLAYVSEFASD